MTCYKVKTEVDQVDHVSGIHNDPTFITQLTAYIDLMMTNYEIYQKFTYIQPFRNILRTSSRRICTIDMKSKDKDQDEDERK
ncbi:unnamed protein product [Rhizophagus irregularis]|nr:unnamed protein product [Rhizophagus irregularis]